MRASLVAGCVIVMFAGCAGRESPEATTTRVSGLMQSVPLAADTFINSAFPDNNSGRSDSIYTGRNGMNGVMRGLLQFTMPAALQGRVTVTGVRLAMTTRGLSSTGTAPPTAATVSLQALSVTWTQGDGVGNAIAMNTVGDPCGATGATWNQPSCTGGAAWSGGSVASSVVGQASVPAALDAVVAWDSATAGNAGMIADVQGWIDTPTNNHGWRIASSTEATMSQAQRFYSSEAGAGAPPALTVTYGCKAGLSELGTGCTACAPNHCRDSGDATAACTDAAGPATGYSCTCSGGFIFNGTTCVGGGGTGGATGGSGGGAGGAGGAGGTGGAGGSGGAAGGGSGGSSGAAGGSSGAAGESGGAAGGGSGGSSGAAGGSGGAAGAAGAAGGADGGSGGATGTGAMGGAAGRGGSGAEGGAAVTGANDDRGCSCALAARSDPSGAVLFAIAALLSMARRRTRRDF